MPVTGILNEDLVRVEGLAISPDGKSLVAAEPDASRIVVFDIPDELEPVTSWTLVDFSPSGVEPKGWSSMRKVGCSWPWETGRK